MLRTMMGGNAIWQLIRQSDVVSRGILFILLVLSIICWAVFLYKLILFRIKKNQMRRVFKDMGKVTNLDDLSTVIAKHKNTLPGYFLSTNISFLKSVMIIDPDTHNPHVDEREWDMFQQNIDQTIEHIMYREQAYLSILSTSAAISPLLGLFGTVWGLVHAFVRISEKQSADIATVAPGIAEALITTLAGLAVAIPAFIMFSYCSTQVRTIDHQFSILADQLLLKLQKLVIKK